jgi:hypothetical protein
MKHFYRILLFVIASSSSALLFGQTQSPNPSPGKLLKPRNQSSKTNSTLKSTLLKDPRHDQNTRNKPFVSAKKTEQSSDFQTSTFTPPYRDCFTVESEKKLAQKYPGRLSTELFEQKLTSRLRSSRLSGDETIYQIPVVVHVVHYGEPLGTGSNISYEQIQSQFEVLNEDFRKLGAGHNEHPSGADINIEFVPALVDPQGKLLREPGVDRIVGYNAYYEYDNIEGELKPNTQWDPDRYMNIWVLNFGGSFANYLGYAQFPSFSGLDGLPDDGASFTDGVVIGYRYFGRTGNVVAPFDKGRTTTHEVGHWLGLRHIWGDGDCSVDDFCADTPNADGPNRTCDARDSCPGEGPDMIENYMDYSTDLCMNIFTNDQKYRIRTVLEVSPRRSSLVACQRPPSALTGSNVSDQPLTWFQYTAPEAQVVKVSSLGSTDLDTRLSFYRDCNQLPINVSDNVLGTQQSELSISLEEGETVKILWQSENFIEPYEWTLSTTSPATGAACELAATAAEGTNTVPATGLNFFWYQFTPATDNQKVSIDGAGKTFTVYKNSCSELKLVGSSATSFNVYDISSDQSIFIAFETNGGDFDWTLDVNDLRNGEACTDAVDAVVGENVIPYPSPFQYWYTYTIPFDGELKIQTPDFPQGTTRLAVFKNCDEMPVAEATGEQFELGGIVMHAGESVKILWDGEGSVENFKWTLQSTAYADGEICSVAKAAKIGLNHTDSAPRWFTYTTKKRSNLTITSVGLTDVNTHVIIKRECDGPITHDNDRANTGGQFYDQSEIVLYGTEAGETFFIQWSEKWSYEGFDWKIEEVDPLPGDNCDNAKRATIGSNLVEYRGHHSNFSNLFWAKYTVPESGKKITAFCSIPIDIAIYTHDNCNTFTWVDGDQGKARAIDLPAGTELVFIWDVATYTENFTWELSVEDIIQGDQCTDPIPAVQGTNVSLSTPIWYDYVMSQAGSLKINYEANLPNVIPHVAVFDGCGDEAKLLYTDVGAAFVSGLNEGDRVLIYWTLGYPFPGTTWSLQEIPQKQGDICSDPLPAVYGLNHADYATQWFTYTAEATGNLKISSRAFTYANTDLYVYDACDGNLIAQNDDVFSFEDFILYYQSEVFLENVEAGQTLLIKWAGTYSFAPFHWEITNDQPRAGDTCEDPLIAVEGVNNGMKPVPQWFSFTMPRTSALTLTALGYSNTNTTVEVYDACNGNIIAANDDFSGDSQSFVHIDELQEGQTVLIRWSNVAVSELYTFDWRLFVGDPDPGLVCQFPAVAQTGVNTTPPYTSIFYWYSFIMPEDNKRLVVKRLGESENRNSTVGVSGNCDGTLNYAIADDEAVVTGLAAGQEVFIFWGEIRGGERPSFDWELKLEDEEPGDDCEKTIVATPGLYHAGPTAKWYQYTIPFHGNLHLSSVGINDDSAIDTYVEVYDACNGNMIASNDNPDDYSHFLSEVWLSDLQEGQSVWIKWGNSGPYQRKFDWTLTVENLDNHAPTLGNVTLYIASPSNGTVLGTLVAEDEDNDELSYEIVSGNDDGAFDLGLSSGELVVANASKLMGLNIARDLGVTVSDGFASTQGTVTLDIVTSAAEDQQSGIKAFPNPAHEKLFLQIPDNVRVYESQFVDLAGSIIKTNDPKAREISLLDFVKGMVLLKLNTDKGEITLRIAVL